MRTGLRLYIYKGVPAWAAKEIKRTMPLLKNVVEVSHWLPVRLVPAPTVSVIEDQQCGFGVFVAFGDERPQICLAGNLRGYMKDYNLDRRDVAWWIVENLVHELVHYEQWRDGRVGSHRGVDRRVRKIMLGLGMVPAEYIRKDAK